MPPSSTTSFDHSNTGLVSVDSVPTTSTLTRLLLKQWAGDTDILHILKERVSGNMSRYPSV